MIRKNTIFRRILVLLVPLLTILFAIFYLKHTHAELVALYKGINSIFYKAETWQLDFFTVKVKLLGNNWCQAAIVVSLIWLFSAWKLPFDKLPAWRYDKKALFEYLMIIIGGAVLSMISNIHTSYAYDEVFSAVNFASLPPFQCMSYYILPNNHMLFNALNHSLFFWSDDQVASGRIISMVSYILVLMLSWNFLKKWVDNYWMRWVVLLSMALQFPVWGFSGQARGYEMVLFFSCLSFFSFWGYWIEKKTYLLFPHVAALVLGMLTLPSFLYWLTGLLLASLFFMIGKKKIDWLYIRYMVAGMSLLFLCYVPLLTFSGLSSMTDNQYMKATAGSSLEFIPKLLNEASYFRHLFAEWFCFDIMARVPGYFLLLLPLVALFNKWNGKPYRPLLNMYFSMLLAFLLVCIVMKNMAFSRNMLAHGYLVWMMLLIVLSSLPKQKWIQKAFLTLMLVATVFSTRENYKFSPYGLYYYDVEQKYESLRACKFHYSPSSSVFLDNESFYWWYVLREKFPNHKHNIESNRPAFKQQDYSIMRVEDIQLADTVMYEKISDCSEFVIFRKRR